MEQKSLLVRPSPILSESPGGFLLRVAEMNGYPSIGIFVRYFLVGRGSRDVQGFLNSKSDCIRLLVFLGYQTNEIDQVFFETNRLTQRSPRQYMNQEIDFKFFLKDLKVYCPFCLGEHLFWRKDWLFAFLPICLTHGVLLIDRCNTCLHELNQSRPRLGICEHCQMDLTKQQPVSADRGVVAWMKGLLEGDGNHFQTFIKFWLALKEFDGLGEGISSNYERLLQSYKFFNKDSSSFAYLINKVNQRITLAHPRIQLVSFLMEKSFSYEISENVLPFVTCVDGVANGGIGKSLFDKSETAVVLGFSRFQLEKFLAIHAEIIEGNLVRKSIPHLLLEKLLVLKMEKRILASKNIDEMTCNNYSDVKAVALTLNTYAEVVRSLFKAQWIMSYRLKLNGRRVTVANQAEVLNFQKKFVLIGELADVWNINVTDLSTKLRYLHVEPLAGPGIDAVKVRLYSRESIKAITKEDVHAIRNYPTPSGRPLKIDQFLQIKHVGEFTPITTVSRLLNISIQKVVVLIHRGILIRYESVFDSVNITTASLENLLAILKSKKYLTLDHAAQQVGMTRERFRHNWTHTGVVKVHDFIYWKFITQKDMNRLKAVLDEFITYRDASEVLGMHRHFFANLCKQGKIEAYTIGRKKLFKRTDVQRIIEEFQAKKSDAFQGVS